MDFRFSPHPNRAHEIEWRSWTDATFREAEELDKPVFLSLSAVWCHWCHVMDETTFSDEEVIAALNRDLIPVRVDNDRRPDINARYNMGGWPTAAFLTPDGEVLMGMTYTPARRFREMMEAVSNLWRVKSADLREEVAAARERAALLPEEESPRVGELNESTVARAFAPLLAVFDREFGGFGDGAKFPRTDILGALLTRVEIEGAGSPVARMLEQTLDAMLENELWDEVEGGFFRYTTRRDWSVPHYEKMLQDNCQLIRILARAALSLGRPDLLEAARRAQAYLDNTLWQGETVLYGGSQDADEEYYSLPAEARRERAAPYVDPMTYTDWNAQAIRALSSLHGATGNESPVDYLKRALSSGAILLERRTTRGLLQHDPSPDSPDSFLGDQVAFFEALLDLYEGTTERVWREEARLLWQAIDREFTLAGSPLLTDLARTESPSPAAAEAEARVGPVARREAPAEENARLAAALDRLGIIERDRELRERARAMLAALVPRIGDLRDFGAEIGRAVLLVLHEPLHLTIVGREEAPESRHLLEGARGIRERRVVDLLDPALDADILDRAGLGNGAQPARAFVCRGNQCSSPVTSPEELQAAAGSPERD